MAEFCLECFNRVHGTDYTEKEVWLDTSELDICEGCGRVLPCVVQLYPKPLLERFKDFLRRK